MYLGLLQAVFGGPKPWVCTRIRGGSGWRKGSCRKVLSEAVKPDAQPLILIYSVPLVLATALVLATNRPFSAISLYIPFIFFFQVHSSNINKHVKFNDNRI